MGLHGDYVCLILALATVFLCVLLKASYGSEVCCSWELCLKDRAGQGMNPNEECVTKEGYKIEMIEDLRANIHKRFKLKTDCKTLDSCTNTIVKKKENTR